MPTLDITTINSGIEDTLAAATGLTYSQDYDELTEGMQDTPTLQVYWAATATDVASGSAQSSFRGKVRQTRLTFHADLYAQQRAHIGEDMAALLPLIDAIQTEIEAQQVQPYFGVSGIQAIEDWSAQQLIFEYATLMYIGARFVIRVRVF